MLRYFTMSSLDWEDEQQQVLLTDPNEIVAVVAEITLNDMDTPDEAVHQTRIDRTTFFRSLDLYICQSPSFHSSSNLIWHKIIERTRTGYPNRSDIDNC
ncbi:hypothetical protein MJO29_006509 [Puccinia striiformis f. sp. tritici]|nr:hypothetical protein MJO29_006509 [Puccinia striiformis f. sp. tritici]